LETTFITYEEAVKLKEFFKDAKKHGPYKEARDSAGRILGELERVRNIDYEPFPGYQLVLSPGDMRFLRDVMGVLDLEG
jgi:hypothetical protein